MKILTVSFTLSFFCSFAQTQKVFFKKYYEVSSIVFAKEYRERFIIKDKKDRIDISIADIELIESYIKKIVTKKLYKYFRCSGRQYLGYISLKDEKKIIVLILNNFRYPNKFPEFEKEFALGFGEFYEDNKNQMYMTFNIDKKILE